MPYISDIDSIVENKTRFNSLSMARRVSRAGTLCKQHHLTVVSSTVNSVTLLLYGYCQSEMTLVNQSNRQDSVCTWNDAIDVSIFSGSCDHVCACASASESCSQALIISGMSRIALPPTSRSFLLPFSPVSYSYWRIIPPLLFARTLWKSRTLPACV